MEHDDDITSTELDGLLDTAETLAVDRPDGSTQMRLYVPVDAETLQELQQRAQRTGTPITEAASDALRTGTHAA